MSDRLRLVEGLARHAGKIAMKMRPTVNLSIKDDGSFVTDADLAVQDFLFAELEKNFPGFGLLGEERCCDPSLVKGGAPAWIVDPIDGTDSYRLGLAYFCVSIGLYEKGRFALGVIYLPVFDEIYSVDAGSGPTRDGEPIRVTKARTITQNSFLAAPSIFHQRFTSDFPGKIRSLGSAAHHMALVASGGAVGAVLFAHIWDIAAGIALVQAAGGKVGRLNGEPIDYERHFDGLKMPRDILAAPAGLFDAIKDTIKSK